MAEPTNTNAAAHTNATAQQHLRDRLTAFELKDYRRQYGAFTQADRQAAADVWADAERMSAES